MGEESWVVCTICTVGSEPATPLGRDGRQANRCRADAARRARPCARVRLTDSRLPLIVASRHLFNWCMRRPQMGPAPGSSTLAWRVPSNLAHSPAGRSGHRMAPWPRLASLAHST